MTRRRLTSEMVAVVFQQLSGCLQAGLSLVDTFTILATARDLPRAQAEFIADATAAVQNTGTLSVALEAYPGTFHAKAIGLVRTCEQSNRLASALALIASDHELRALQRFSIIGALSWPLAAFAVLVVVAVVLTTFVTPAFKDIFASFGADLPGPTFVVIALSDLAIGYWYLALAAAVALFLIVQRYRARGQRSRIVDAILIRIPFVRAYLIKCFISRVIQILDGAMGRDLPLVPTVEYLGATAGNAWLARIAEALETQLRAGKDLAAAVRDTPNMPGQIAVAVEIGTRTKSSGAALRQVAAFSEGEAARGLMQLQQALVISTYILAGSIVGFFVIAMYLPIFKMGQF